MDLRQKSKCSWLTEGDDNTKFFHAKMVTRRHTDNSFLIVNETGQIIKTEEQMCNDMISYYKALYNSEFSVTEFPEVISKVIISNLVKTI